MIKDAYRVSTLRYAVKYNEKKVAASADRFGTTRRGKCFRYYLSFAIMGRTCPQGFG